jgi:hypothetical protein
VDVDIRFSPSFALAVITIDFGRLMTDAKNLLLGRDPVTETGSAEAGGN